MYKINPQGIEFGVFRTTDNLWIPNCADNTDWQEYLAWVAEGNTAEPWED